MCDRCREGRMERTGVKFIGRAMRRVSYWAITDYRDHLIMWNYAFRNTVLTSVYLKLHVSTNMMNECWYFGKIFDGVIKIHTSLWFCFLKKNTYSCNIVPNLNKIKYVLSNFFFIVGLFLLMLILTAVLGSEEQKVLSNIWSTSSDNRKDGVLWSWQETSKVEFALCVIILVQYIKCY